MHIGSASTGMKLWRRTPSYWFDSRLHYFTKNHGAGYAALATLGRVAGSTPTLSPNAKVEVHWRQLAERQIRDDPADQAGRAWDD